MKYFLRNTISLKDCELDWININSMANKYNKPNKWFADTGYGFIDIYKDYAGIENTFIPRINTLHGTFMGMNNTWWYNSEAGFKSVPAMFVHYPSLKIKLEQLFENKKRFILAQHPYHIILKNYKYDISDIREGSVLFLTHTLGMGKPLNLNFLIDVLNKLPKNFHPIKICIHPNDINSVAIRDLTNANYKIVCCGSRYDPLFLHRFFWVCNGVENCLSIDFSTHTILSSLSGLKIHSLLDLIPTMNWIHGNYVLPYTIPDKEYWPLLDQYFSKNIDQLLFRNTSIIVTGGDLELSPVEIKNIFISTKINAQSRRGYNNLFRISCNDWTRLEYFIIKLKAYKKAIQNRLSGNNSLIQPVSSRIIYDLYIYSKTFLCNEK